MANEFQRENNIDLRKDKQALQRLKDAAEKAKIELSGVMTANINLRSSPRTRLAPSIWT